MVNVSNTWRDACYQKMGSRLGELYLSIATEIADLHLEWREYRGLFAGNQDRFDLMNATAPRFFYQLDKILWSAVLLHLCRLTDPAKTAGKENLTIRRLVEEIDDEALRREVADLVTEAVRRTKFARDWRNRRLAHRDLAHAKDPQVKPLASASRGDVEDALKAITEVVNMIEFHYEGAPISYDHTVQGPGGGVEALFYFLRLGYKADVARKKEIMGSSEGGD